MKKVFAVSTAALAAMALIPTAVSFAAEDTVTLNITVTRADGLKDWHVHDWSPDVDGKSHTPLNVSGNTGTISFDIPVDQLSSYGMVFVGADVWDVAPQTEDVKLPAVTAKAGDTVDVTVKILSEADDKDHLKVDVTANVKAPVASTPADSTPADSTPADSTPADSTPADSTPADSTTADSTTTADGNTSADANTDTGVEGVAAVLGVAAVAAGAMIVAKKRK